MGESEAPKEQTETEQAEPEAVGESDQQAQAEEPKKGYALGDPKAGAGEDQEEGADRAITTGSSAGPVVDPDDDGVATDSGAPSQARAPPAQRSR